MILKKINLLRMRKCGQLALILILVFNLLIIESADAQYKQSEAFKFLNYIFDQHDQKLHSFLLNELNHYIATFEHTDDLSDIYFLLAKAYEEQGKVRKSLAAYLKIIYLFPESQHHAEWAQLIKNIVINQHHDKRNQDKIFKAVNKEETELNQQDRYFNYLSLLSKLNFKELNDWFLASCREFTRLYPNDKRNDQVILWVADIYTNQKKYLQADMTYHKFEFMFRESKLYPKAIYLQAMLLLNMQNEIEQAMVKFQRVVEEFPENRYAGDALFQMAQINETKLEDYRESIRNYQKIVNQYPEYTNSIDVLIRIADINKHQLKNYWGAIYAYNQVVEIDTIGQFGKQALEEIAAIYKKKIKDYENTVETYSRLVKLYPNSKEAPKRLYDAGKICENKLQDYQRAVLFFHEILDKYPTHGKALLARKRVTELESKLNLNYYSEKRGE